MRISIPFVLTLLAANTVASARAQTRPAQSTVATETRVYNVAGLLTQMQDYPIRGKSELKFESVEDVVTSLIDAIENTVNAETWHGNAGGEGSIRVFNGTSMIVVASADTHAGVQKLLDQLQRESVPSRLVRIEATWVLLNGDDLKEARAGMKGRADDAAIVVPDSILDRANIYSRGYTMGFDRQTVYIESGVQRRYISSMSPIVGQGAVGYDATMETVNDGVSLQVRPHLAVGENNAVVDVMSMVSEVSDAQDGSRAARAARPAAAPATRPSESTSNGTVSVEVPDRLNVLSQHFHTTVRLPIGESVIVGGMTLEPAAHGVEARSLYLVIRVTASPK